MIETAIDIWKILNEGRKEIIIGVAIALICGTPVVLWQASKHSWRWFLMLKAWVRKPKVVYASAPVKTDDERVKELETAVHAISFPVLPGRSIEDLRPKPYVDLAEIEQLKRELANTEVHSAYAAFERSRKEARLAQLLRLRDYGAR